MRVMMNLIEAADLEHELQEDMIDATGNPRHVWLGYTSDMDEASDEEDPQATLEKEVAELRKEAADKQSMIQAVQGAMECRSVMTDLERARMQLEDVRNAAALRAPRSTTGAPEISAAALPLRT